MIETKGTLEFNEKQKTTYCISTDQRDEQVKIAMRKVQGRVQKEGDKEQECAIIGYGPSLSDTWREAIKFPVIFTCSGAHKFLIEKGLSAHDFERWIHVDLEPRPHKVKLLGEPQHGIEYKIASTIAPNYLDKLEGFDVKLWHIFANDDDFQRILPPGELAITGGSDVGMRTMVIARLLGYKNMHIFGIDGSTGKTGFHAAEHPNQPPYQMETELNGKKFYTTPALMQCAKQMPKELDELVDVNAKFYGNGLVQEIMKDYKRTPHVNRSSFIAFDKPELISDEYKKLNTQLHESNVMYGTSGGKHAETVIKLLKTLVTEDNPFPSCLDYGCGKGFLGKALPFPIFEYDPAVPGKEESPKPADLVVCTDVLEHIEPDKLTFVLGDLRRCVKRVGFFVISTRQAVKTYSNGQNAHLIVKGKQWWEDKLNKFFTVPENGIIYKDETKELHVVVGPKVKEEAKDITYTENEDLRIKFHTPNETTRWRAETAFTKEVVTVNWIKSMKKGSVLYDIGANIGVYSVIAGSLGMDVYAFEPEADNHAMLLKNLELNRLNTNAYCVAVSDVPSIGNLYVNSGGAGQACHSFGEDVSPELTPTRHSSKQGCISLTVDQLLEMGLPTPDYVKIDVDGFEKKVIDGAKNTISKYHPQLLIEINPEIKEHREILDYLDKEGYSYSEEQVEKARRKDGPFKGVAEYIFTKKDVDWESVRETIDLRQAIDTVEDRLYYAADSVKDTALELEPYNHLYVENLLTEADYKQLREDLEKVEYIEIEKSRGTRGYPLRFTGKHPEWIAERLCNGEFKKALLDKFGIEDEGFVEDLLLVKDLPGYSIPPHTDSLKKVITVLIYLNDIPNAGTSIYVPKQKGYTDITGKHHRFEDFDKVKTMPFKGNSAFIFARTDDSFHGVEPCNQVRDVLLYNINRK